jgi:hypothetical protein
MINVIAANYPKLRGNDFQLLKSSMGGPVVRKRHESRVQSS